MRCNLTTCRYNKENLCTQGDKRKECLDAANKVLCIDATDNNVITIGDKIRESNESLVEWYANRVNLYVCGESVTVNPLNKEKCLNYLDQPYTDTTN